MSELSTVVQFVLFLALLGVAVATIIMPFVVICILRCLRRMESKLKTAAPYLPAIHKETAESAAHLRNLTP